MGSVLIAFLIVCVTCAAPLALVAFLWREMGSPYSAPSMRTPRTFAAAMERAPVPEEAALPAALVRSGPRKRLWWAIRAPRVLRFRQLRTRSRISPGSA
jgi:hypothetical protein